jgi:hypothetical protein
VTDETARAPGFSALLQALLRRTEMEYVGEAQPSALREGAAPGRRVHGPLANGSLAKPIVATQPHAGEPQDYSR